MRGKGSLQLTSKHGEVIRESVNIALSGRKPAPTNWASNTKVNLTRGQGVHSGTLAICEEHHN
jgi:ATP-dependent Lon protease